MSKRGKERKALSSNLPARVGYDVGYGKPPSATRFQSGQSGNPRGRPKGAKNKIPALNVERLKDIILAEAYRTIKVRDGERHVTVPIAQAVIRSLAVNAAKGQHRAQRLFAKLLGDTEAANKRWHDEWLEVAIGYKVEWEQELERRKRLGIEAPDPIPHPDDIVVDLRADQVTIKGPLTKEEKAERDWLLGRKAEVEEQLAEFQQMLIEDPDHEHKAQIEDEFAHSQRILEILSKAFPE